MLNRTFCTFMSFLLISLLTLAISGCGSGGGGDTIIIYPPTVGEVEVKALYLNNGANWNDYVVGGDITNATDAACDPSVDTACIKGGLYRTFQVPGVMSCTNITAFDGQDAFEWTCDDSTAPVRMISTGLKDGKGLSDLIDFDSSIWRDMYVIVLDSGALIYATAITKWWDNVIVTDNDGGYLDAAGTIYTVTANSNNNYIINSSSVGLVVKPGAVINGTDAGGNVVSADGTAEARDFIYIEGEVDATGDDIGINLDTVRFSMLRGITADGADSGTDKAGIYLSASTNNKLTDITARINTQFGVWLDSSSNNNTLTNITAGNNTENGVSLQTSTNNTLTDITAGRNTDYGVYLITSSNNTLTNITAGNNGIGVHISSSSNNNTLTDITAGNNRWGVSLRTSSSNTLSDITASNNDDGVYLDTSSNNYFTGELKVGNNTLNDCYVNLGTNPGLDNSTCANNGSSDAALTNSASVTVASSFVGKVTSYDTTNASDSSGMATYPGDPDTFDWTSFDNPYRTWGFDGSAFPNADHRSRWWSGTGRIWDWSMMAADTVIVDTVSYPDTGDIANTVTHLWSAANSATCDTIVDATWGAACSLPGYTDQTSCENATGDWDTTDKCYTVILRGAKEIHGDGTGNDNNLCESGEDCLYTPNMGSYQGHGNLISAGAFTDGTLTGITLWKYDTNGY